MIASYVNVISKELDIFLFRGKNGDEILYYPGGTFSYEQITMLRLRYYFKNYNVKVS